MYALYLQAVDSALATPEQLQAAQLQTAPLPQGWTLRAHQVTTITALRDGDSPIVVNSAMTGDGKTLAGQFTLLNDRWPTFTMYPTNELAADQQRSLDSLFERWSPPSWHGHLPDYRRVDADELDRLQVAVEEVTRSEALMRRLDNALVLTNPDIFHYIMQFRYQRFGGAADLVIQDIVNRYRLFVFDEFHLFGAAQVASVLMTITLIRALSANSPIQPRFLFLSATPQELLNLLAAKIDLKVKHITGEYQHGLAQPPQGYTRILRPAKLVLHDGKLEIWVAEHLDDIILPFFVQNRPGAKGVIIANSVATAHRIHAMLKPREKEMSITVGLNTGLVDKAERVTDADLLIATSTVDVGVDFRINLLIFESIDAASHIQRLGRLGRHEDDGNGHSFEHFEAHALLPGWVIDELKKVLPDDATVCRAKYSETLHAKYPPLQQFEGYVQRWAGIQATNVLTGLGSKEIRTQYVVLREGLYQTYRALFPGLGRYKRLLDKECKAIVEEATSFRGGSPFMALVRDMTSETQRVVAYNLFSVLLNGELEEAEIQTLLDEAERQGKSVKSLKRVNPIAGYRLRGWLPAPRKIGLRLVHQVDMQETDLVVEMRGFRFDVDGPAVAGLQRLNNALEERTLVAFLTTQTPDNLRRRWRLGFQLDLFAFRSANGIEGTAAIGRDALLLDSVINRFNKPKDNRPCIL